LTNGGYLRSPVDVLLAEASATELFQRETIAMQASKFIKILAAAALVAAPVMAQAANASREGAGVEESEGLGIDSLLLVVAAVTAAIGGAAASSGGESPTSP